MKRYAMTTYAAWDGRQERVLRRERDLMLPLHEPRCAGRGCEQKAGCERYNRLVYENLTRNSKKGHSVAMTLVDDDGVCRRKL